MEPVVFFQEIFFPFSFTRQRDVMSYEEWRISEWRGRTYLEKWRIEENFDSEERIQTYIGRRQIINGD